MPRINLRARLRSSAFDRARTGASFGLLMAGFYVGYVVLLYLLRGNAPFERHEITLGAAVLAYVVGGVLGGGVVGILQPLTSWRIGSMFVATVTASIVFFFIGTASDGPPWRWGTDEWEAVGVLGLIFGVLLGSFYHPTEKRSTRAVEAPRLRTVLPRKHNEPEA